MGPRRALPSSFPESGGSKNKKVVRIQIPSSPPITNGPRASTAGIEAVDGFRFGFSFANDLSEGHNNEENSSNSVPLPPLPNPPESCRYVFICGHHVAGPAIGRMLRVNWDESSHFFLRLVDDEGDDDDPDSTLREYDVPPSKVRQWGYYRAVYIYLGWDGHLLSIFYLSFHP